MLHNATGQSASVMAFWSVSTLSDTVTQELERLPADMRARFTKVSALIDPERKIYITRPEAVTW